MVRENTNVPELFENYITKACRGFIHISLKGFLHYRNDDRRIWNYLFIRQKYYIGVHIKNKSAGNLLLL